MRGEPQDTMEEEECLDKTESMKKISEKESIQILKEGNTYCQIASDKTENIYYLYNSAATACMYDHEILGLYLSGDSFRLSHLINEKRGPEKSKFKVTQLFRGGLIKLLNSLCQFNIVSSTPSLSYLLHSFLLIVHC